MSMNVHEFNKMKGEPLVQLALAGGKSYTEAAQIAGVTVKTIMRRMSDDRYRRQVAAVRADMIDRAAGQLAEHAAAAVETLTGLLNGESEQVRLGAARAILDSSVRYRELTELNERLARLEELLEAGDPTIRRLAS